MAPIHELRYIPQNNTLYVATFGRSMWKVPMPTAADFEPGALITQPGGGSQPATAKRRVVVGKKVTFTRGALRVPLSCRATTACKGTLVALAGRKTLARKSFSVPAGKTRTVLVKAKGAKGRALKKARKLKLTATLRADASGPGGRFSATRRVARR